MKTVSVKLAVTVAATALLLGCTDNEELKEQGKLAASEFCDCYKKYSWKSCLVELRSNYEDHKHYVFADAFDDANTCGMSMLRLKAHEAATEFCDCLEKNSESKCIAELNTNYSSYTTDEFAEMLDEVNDCNYDFRVVRTSASMKPEFVLK